MTSYDNSNNRLFNVFLNDIPDKFIGKLEVKSSRQSWIILLCVSPLAWLMLGKHYNRLFHKIWHQFCSNISLDKIKLREGDDPFCYYYYIMSVLLLLLYYVCFLEAKIIRSSSNKSSSI
jgi:hypothetical protein